MVPIPIRDILFIMAIVLFCIGLLSTIAGIIVLIFRASGKDINTLAIQSTRLVQKGLAEDVAGLVGNASALLETVNQLVRTTAGIGVFLTVFGMVMMLVASWLALQIL